MASDELFNTFSKNLALYDSSYLDSFICPLQVSPKCKKIYKKIDLYLLNKAHIWPKSLGGKQHTLACEHCNSYIGTKLESHMGKHAKFLEDEKLPYRMTFKEVNGSVGGKLEMDGKNYTFHVDNRVSNQHTIREIQDPEVNPFDTEVKFEINGGYEPRKVNLGYLHFAYLYLFHEYGYEWFFSQVAQKVRNQLKEIDQRLFEPLWVAIGRNIPDTKPQSPFHSFVIVPHEMMALSVITPVLTPYKVSRAAILLLFNQTTHDSTKLCILPPEYFANRELCLRTPPQHNHTQLGEKVNILGEFMQKNFSI